MGAAAFLMVEYSGFEYRSIAVRAILPAVLYFSEFHYRPPRGQKARPKGYPPRELLPKFGKLMLHNGILLLPLILLGLLIIHQNHGFCVILATLMAIAVSNIRKAPVSSGIAVSAYWYIPLTNTSIRVFPLPDSFQNIILGVVVIAMLISILHKKRRPSLLRRSGRS